MRHDEPLAMGATATRCFIHVPKSAGCSVHDALTARLPQGSVSPVRYDTSVFCNFDSFDQLRPEVRAQLATTDAELSPLTRYSVVLGHFSLRSLLTIAPARAISTILREPRSRLLSLYAYWRVTNLTFWEPYRAHHHAQRPFDEFLEEQRLAPVIDNQVCRLILSDDSRLTADGFMSPNHASAVAADALTRLDALGFVGIQELPDLLWPGLSKFFGVRLDPQTANVTAGAAENTSSGRDEPLTARVLELVEQRTAADRVLYGHVSTRILGDEQRAESLAESAFSRQLLRFTASARHAVAPQ